MIEKRQRRDGNDFELYLKCEETSLESLKQRSSKIDQI